MATGLFLCSAPMIKMNHVSIKRPANSRLVVMSTNNHASTDLQFRSSHKHKVFEDRSTGIVCHMDENGEIICEGYDEGPRFHQQLTRFSYYSRDAEIIEILERCWVHVANEND